MDRRDDDPPPEKRGVSAKSGSLAEKADKLMIVRNLFKISPMKPNFKRPNDVGGHKRGCTA